MVSNLQSAKADLVNLPARGFNRQGGRECGLVLDLNGLS